MIVGLWFFACATVAVALRHRPVATIAAAIFLRTLVPSAAAPFFTGQTTDSQLQPATYFLAMALILALAFRARTLGVELSRHLPFYLTLGVVLAASIVITAALRPPHSVVVLVDTLVFGVLLCLLIRATIGESLANGVRIANVVIAAATVQALIAILQFATGRTLFWESYMGSYYWWSPTATRVSGTMGAWLDLALLLAIAVPLAWVIRRIWLRISVVTLLIIGIILSQSRFALVVGIGCMLILIFLSKMRLSARILSILVTFVLGWTILSSDLVAGITNRFTADTLSFVARAQASTYVWENIWAQPWHGSGFGANGLTRSSGLISSFENGYLMYAWDIGIFFTLVLFAALASPLLIGAMRGTIVPGAWLALATALVLIGTYSGFQTPGPAAWLTLTMVGVCVPNLARRPKSMRSQMRLLRTGHRSDLVAVRSGHTASVTTDA